MIYLLGNCQMEFLGRALSDRGLACDYRPLASPEGALKTEGIPPELAAWAERIPLHDYLHGRSLKNQFQVFTPDDPAPSCIVLNLFHENEPLFASNSMDWFFFVDPAVWTAYPDFADWMQTRSRQFKPNPESYPDRWAALAAALRATFPDVPLVLATRLGHHPAFGPGPRSYLACWDKHWRAMVPFVYALAMDIGAHVLDVDKIFAGIWRNNPDMNAHCPFLRLGKNGRLPARHRDLEHVADLWPVLAERLDSFLASGELRYTEQENPPRAWSLRPNETNMDPERLYGLLASGSNYMAGQAVAYMVQHPEEDRIDLLARAAEAMPICHHTLHMVRHLANMHQDPEASGHLAHWAKAQAAKIESFTDNGPEYQRQYREKLAELAEPKKPAPCGPGLGPIPYPL